MSNSGAMLDEAIEFLGFSRDGTIGEARNIPDDRWEWRPNPKSRTVSQLVRHIIETTGMLVGEASDPQGDFQRRPYPEHVRAHVHLPEKMSPKQLREALERTHSEMVGQIRTAGHAEMAKPIRRFDGGSWSRLTYVFYAAQHEDYHRGQLALYARMMGLVPKLTKDIYGKDAE